MTRNLRGVLTLGFGLFLAAAPALAHHACQRSSTEQADHVHGTVKKVDWMNPHIYTHIEAKDANGKTVVYQSKVARRILSSEWMAAGFTENRRETVSVTGSRAKSEASFRVSGTITKADGTRVWARRRSESAVAPDLQPQRKHRGRHQASLDGGLCMFVLCG
jgi:hypothetical protein